jgi:hypothetical protein
MVWEIGIMIAVLTLAVGYLRWKSTYFQRPSEIEESITRSYNNYRVFEDAKLMYTVVNVLAEKPGFPERLYKYVPFVEREGFVDVQLAILPYNKDSVRLPSPEEIEEYDLFPSHTVEIRNVTWSDKPVQDANIQLRVHYFKDRYVINGVHAAMVSIVESITGEVDERYHAQFKHTDINSSKE